MIVETDGFKFEFPQWYLEKFADKPKTSFWLTPVYRPDEFETQERAMIRKYIEPTDRVLEVGGFVGFTSCLINSLLENRDAHVVVELLPEYAKMLEHNRDTNGCRFWVECGQLVEPSKRIHRDWYHKEKSVELAKLERLVGLMGLSFNTLVMDAEGAEFDFIDQYPAFVAGLDKIMMEWHRVNGQDRHEIRDEYCAKLEGWGFQLVERIDNVDFWRKP